VKKCTGFFLRTYADLATAEVLPLVPPLSVARNENLRVTILTSEILAFSEVLVDFVTEGFRSAAEAPGLVRR